MKKQLVFKEVISLLKKRDKQGWKNYGKPMTTFDDRDTLQDAIEEVADLLVYLVKLDLEVKEYSKNKKKQKECHLCTNNKCYSKKCCFYPKNNK